MQAVDPKLKLRILFQLTLLYLGPYAEISLVARSRSSLTTSLTTRTTSYSEIALEVVLQVSLLVRLASLTS